MEKDDYLYKIKFMQKMEKYQCVYNYKLSEHSKDSECQHFLQLTKICKFKYTALNTYFGLQSVINNLS
jgi:hypothetical protein